METISSSFTEPSTIWRRIGLVVFSGMGLSSIIDVVSDIMESAGRVHITVEIAVVVFSLASFYWLWKEKKTLHVTARELQSELKLTKSVASEWHAKASRFSAGLLSAIESQFQAWGLSQAEKDVSLLLIKGFGLKEIATLRGTSERTVRQQAQESYRKAGIDGRVQLAAYFLEDLLQGIEMPAASPATQAALNPLEVH